MAHWTRFSRYLFASLLLFLAGPAHAILDLAIEMNPDPVRANERLLMELTVANTGPGVATNITLAATVPNDLNRFLAGAAIDGASVTGTATCPISNTCDSGEDITWTLSNLPPGGSVTVAAWAIVTNGTADGTEIVLDATVSYDSNPDVNESKSVFVDSDAALELALDEDLDPAQAGDTLVYTLTYGNRSVNSVTSSTLTLPLPSGVSFVSASGGGSESGGTVTWNLGTVLAGESDREQVVVTVDAVAAGTVLLIDAATLEGTNGGTFLTETANAMAVTRVTASVGLALALEMNPDPVRPGERVRMELTVANQSGSALFDVRLLVRGPDDLARYTSTTPINGGRVTRIAGCPASSTCDPGELVDWNLGTLPAGASTTVAAWTNVAAPDDGQLIKLDAVVTANGGAQTLATHTVAADSDAALELALDEDFDPVQAGDTLTYTLTYGNRSANSVTGATLSLPLPPGVTFDDASGNGSESGGTVTWNLGTVLAGESGRQQAVVTVDAVAAGTMLPIDAATLEGTNGGTFLTETTNATAVTRVTASVGLALALEMNPDPVRPGERVRMELTVANQSGSALFDVVLLATGPDDLARFTSSTPINGGDVTGTATCPASNTCDPGELVEWNLATLPAGASTTVAAWTNVLSSSSAPDDGQLIKLDAVVTATGGTQTSATHTVAADSDGAWSLTLDEVLDPTGTGDTVTYAMTFGNRSANSITDADLSFPIPAGTTLEGSSGGTQTNGTVTWDLGTVVSGAGGRRTATVSVNGGTGDGSVLPIDAATISGTNGLTLISEVANATAVTRVDSDSRLSLDVELSPNPIQPGDALTATFTVTNVSGASIADVTLLATIAEKVARFSPIGSETCPASNTCDPGEMVEWDLGTLLAGQSVVVTASTTIVTASSAPADGRLFPWDADLRGDGGNETVATDSHLIGTFSDNDNDSVANIFDNCIESGNSDQTDTNFDGFGNLCDADISNDNVVDFADLPAFQAAFFSQVGDLNYNEDADLNGDGVVDFGDLPFIQQQFFGAPGPSGLISLP